MKRKKNVLIAETKENKIYLVVTIIMFTILIFLFTIGKYQPSSNPDKDVCEGRYIEYNSFSDLTNMRTYFSDGKERDCYSDPYYNADKTISYYYSYCCEKDKWRPKTKCELNPNDKDCVCDEYEQIKKQHDIWIEIPYTLLKGCNKNICITGIPSEWDVRNVNILGGPLTNFSEVNTTCSDLTTETYYEQGDCIKAHETPKPIKIDLEKEKCVEHKNESFSENVDCNYESKKCDEEKDINDIMRMSGFCGLYNQYCCLKKETKTECEKGNPDYIEKRYIFPCMEEDKECLNQKQTECVPKTIHDISCEELKEESLKEESEYCLKYEFGPLCLSKWRNSKLGTDKELFFEYLDRCIND